MIQAAKRCCNNPYSPDFLSWGPWPAKSCLPGCHSDWCLADPTAVSKGHCRSQQVPRVPATVVLSHRLCPQQILPGASKSDNAEKNVLMRAACLLLL